MCAAGFAYSGTEIRTTYVTVDEEDSVEITSGKLVIQGN